MTYAFYMSLRPEHLVFVSKLVIVFVSVSLYRRMLQVCNVLKLKTKLGCGWFKMEISSLRKCLFPMTIDYLVSILSRIQVRYGSMDKMLN